MKAHLYCLQDLDFKIKYFAPQATKSCSERRMFPSYYRKICYGISLLLQNPLLKYNFSLWITSRVSNLQPVGQIQPPGVLLSGQPDCQLVTGFLGNVAGRSSLLQNPGPLSPGVSDT